MNQGHARRAPVPVISGLRPAKNMFCTPAICRYHRRNQVVHQRIVVGPTPDAPQPGFEKLELLIIEFAGQSFQKEHSKVLFIEHLARKKLVGNFQ